MSKSRKSGPGWWDRFKLNIGRIFGVQKILCDSCKYDWRGACRHPERPNAVWCPDYEKRW